MTEENLGRVDAVKIKIGQSAKPGLGGHLPGKKVTGEIAGIRGFKHVSLVITGGLRVSSDIAKALAMGADAVALGSAAMMAIGCEQYRICDGGRCPKGIATQDPALRARLDIEAAAAGLANYLRVTTEDLRDFGRLTGTDDVHGLSLADLCTASSEISNHTGIEHV